MQIAPVPTALTLPRARWTLWLAVWLTLFGALAPTVSHALQWARGGAAANLIEICTSAGPRWMALPGSAVGNPAAFTQASLTGDAILGTASPAPTDTGGSGAPAVLEHCPFCLLMAGWLAPPSAANPVFFAVPGHAAKPQPPCVSDLPAQHFAAAQPRGPPAF